MPKRYVCTPHTSRRMLNGWFMDLCDVISLFLTKIQVKALQCVIGKQIGKRI